MINYEIVVLGSGDESRLANVGPDVFDHAVREELLSEFLADPRHHMVVACGGGEVIGFASAVSYVHPDKQLEMWINELSVSPPHRRQGLASRLVAAMLEVARELGCREAWVLTDRENLAARQLYSLAGGSETRHGPVMFEFPLGASQGDER